MFSKELESLIEAALVDGKIDEIEKRVLVKRAEKDGVDIDELEVYINSILQKRSISRTAEEDAREAAILERKRQDIGIVCPHCGNPIPPLAESCPVCGQIILTAAVNSKIEKAFAEINELSSKAHDPGQRQQDAYIAKTKSKILELKTMYGTVNKVQVYCQHMEEDIAKLKKKIIRDKVLFIVFYILFFAGLITGMILLDGSM